MRNFAELLLVRRELHKNTLAEREDAELRGAAKELLKIANLVFTE